VGPALRASEVGTGRATIGVETDAEFLPVGSSEFIFGPERPLICNLLSRVNQEMVPVGTDNAETGSRR